MNKGFFICELGLDSYTSKNKIIIDDFNIKTTLAVVKANHGLKIFFVDDVIILFLFVRFPKTLIFGDLHF